MSSMNRTRVFLRLPRAVRAFLSLTAVTAVIVGIIAMHVWMGGHGAAGAHGAGMSIATVPAAVPMIDGPNPEHTGSHHGAAPAADVGTTGPADGCAGDCGNDGAALGLCVLALIVVTMLAFLLPAGRLVPGATLLRGPPRISLRPLAIPGPSLIRLCISRT